MTKITAKQSELTTAQQTLAGYKKSKDDYGKNYASVVRLGKAVPEDDDVRSLLVQLDAQAGGGGRGLPHDRRSAAWRRPPPRPTRPAATQAVAPGRRERRLGRLLGHALHASPSAGSTPTCRTSSPAWSAS